MRSRRDTQHSFLHTKQRMYERYGMKISKEDYNKLCWIADKMQDKGLPEANGKDIHVVLEVPFKSQKIVCVYSNAAQCVKTVLPRGTKIKGLDKRR